MVGIESIVCLVHFRLERDYFLFRSELRSIAGFVNIGILDVMSDKIIWFGAGH